MVDSSNFREIVAQAPTVSYTGDHILVGIPIPKARRIELFSPDEWEQFVEEWAHSIKPKYFKVESFLDRAIRGSTS